MDTVLHPDFSGELSQIDNAVGVPVKFFYVIKQFVDIDVLDINAVEKNNGAQISWEVAGEANISRYEIEKSKDGAVFFLKTIINPASNGSISNIYNYVDPGINDGITYYRIKAVSGDHKYFYSAIAVVDGRRENPVSIFPNPAAVEIQVDGCGSHPLIKITDFTGRLVLICNTAGKINISSLPSGRYQLECITTGNIYRKSFLKL